MIDRRALRVFYKCGKIKEKNEEEKKFKMWNNSYGKNLIFVYKFGKWFKGINNYDSKRLGIKDLNNLIRAE